MLVFQTKMIKGSKIVVAAADANLLQRQCRGGCKDLVRGEGSDMNN